MPAQTCGFNFEVRHKTFEKYLGLSRLHLKLEFTTLVLEDNERSFASRVAAAQIARELALSLN